MRVARQNRLGVPATLLLAASALVGRAEPPAEPGPIDQAKAEKAVKAHLAKVKGGHGVITHIKDDSVKKAIPTYQFFSVLFRQFPIARVPPAGLKASNVFAVDPAGKVRVFSEKKDLEKFFKERMTAVTADKAMKSAALTWVRLSTELHNDGYYKFKIDADDAKITMNKAGSKVVIGKATVMQGGSGMITAQLSFGKGGQLGKVSEDAKVKPGPRPICQATKLLDKDPVVRKMAEQDLLIMGRPAKSYLDEQKAKASPQLKKAIEAIWKRICEDDR